MDGYVYAYRIFVVILVKCAELFPERNFPDIEKFFRLYIKTYVSKKGNPFSANIEYKKIYI